MITFYLVGAGLSFFYYLFFGVEGETLVERVLGALFVGAFWIVFAIGAFIQVYGPRRNHED